MHFMVLYYEIRYKYTVECEKNGCWCILNICLHTKVKYLHAKGVHGKHSC